MQLRDYLHVNKIKKKDFAKKIRYSFGYLGRVCEFIRRPSERFAEDVEKATKGHVTAKEMLKASYTSDYFS